MLCWSCVLIHRNDSRSPLQDALNKKFARPDSVQDFAYLTYWWLPEFCKDHSRLPCKVSWGFQGRQSQVHCSWWHHPTHLLCKTELSEQQPSMGPLPLRMSPSLSLSQSTCQRLKAYHSFLQRSWMLCQPGLKSYHHLHYENEDVLHHQTC